MVAVVVLVGIINEDNNDNRVNVTELTVPCTVLRTLCTFTPLIFPKILSSFISEEKNEKENKVI